MGDDDQIEMEKTDPTNEQLRLELLKLSIRSPAGSAVQMDVIRRAQQWFEWVKARKVPTPSEPDPPARPQPGPGKSIYG